MGRCQRASKMSGSERCPAEGAERPERGQRAGSRAGLMSPNIDVLGCAHQTIANRWLGRRRA